MALLTVMVYPVDGAPYVLGMPNTLEAMQGVVGGYIEAVKVADDLNLVCNEEGIGLGLMPNPHTEIDGHPLSDRVRLPDGRHILGTFFVCGPVDDDGEFTDVPDRMLSGNRDPVTHR